MLKARSFKHPETTSNVLVFNLSPTSSLSRTLLGMDSKEVKAIWRSADAVCFDVDSTVCMDEGIDELAFFLGVGLEVGQVTKQAMNGALSFQDSLSQRLHVMQPSRQDVAKFLSKISLRLTDGIRELVAILHERKVPVYLVSGGFDILIKTVAKELHIPSENIFANRLLFYYDGGYAGFDKTRPTSESGGKPKVMSLLKAMYGFKCLVHVGDGTTDMEACPPADAFVGFGGNQLREKVRENSGWYVTSFQEMIDELA